jgi:hypothetical protein
MRLMAKPTPVSHAALVKRELQSEVRENAIIEPGDEVGQVVGKIAGLRTAGWRRYGALKKPVDVASTGFDSRCQKLDTSTMYICPQNSSDLGRETV